jgi:hypothetical protein
MTTGHDKYERLIDGMVLDPLSAPAWQELRGHLRDCDACRARYDRVALAERMLHGGPAALATPSPASFDRIGAAVLDGLEPAPKPAWKRALAWLAPPQRWGVALAAMLVVAILPVVLRPTPPDANEFQARGGRPAERAAGLRAFCLDQSGVTPRCTRASQLKLTVSNGGGFGRVFLVGVDDQWNLKWYAPRPPELASVPAPVGVDQPVGAAVRVGVNHDPGKVRIYALFSDTPVSASEIEAAAAALGRDHKLPSAEAVLPIGRGDVVQKSVVVNVEP